MEHPERVIPERTTVHSDCTQPRGGGASGSVVWVFFIFVITLVLAFYLNEHLPHK